MLIYARDERIYAFLIQIQSNNFISKTNRNAKIESFWNLNPVHIQNTVIRLAVHSVVMNGLEIFAILIQSNIFIV